MLAVLTLAVAGFAVGGRPGGEAAPPPPIAVALGSATAPDLRVTYAGLDVATAPYLTGSVSLGWDSPAPVRTSVYVGLPAPYRVSSATFGPLGTAGSDVLASADVRGEDGIASQVVAVPVDVPAGRYVMTVGFSFGAEAFRAPSGGFRDHNRVALQRGRGDLAALVPDSVAVTDRADGFSVMAISLSSERMITERVPNPTDLTAGRTRWRGPLLDVTDPAAPFVVSATTSDVVARFLLQSATLLVLLAGAAAVAYAAGRRRATAD